jgi:hypothetical protein
MRDLVFAVGPWILGGVLLLLIGALVAVATGGAADPSS